jgi:hypothetical protein
MIMMQNKRLESDSAQINIDFLAGISIFLISFLLAVQLVPNLFIPFQGQPVTLHSVAYRTSVILCEDPGWYNGTNVSGTNQTWNGTNWEVHPDNVSRMGLAKNKFSSNLSTPLTLSASKIITLAELYNSSDPDSYSHIQEKLGLTTSYRKYDYNISMVRFDGILSSYMNGTPILQIGSNPPSNIDIEKVERTISFDKDLSNEKDVSLKGYIYDRIDSPNTVVQNIDVNVPVGAFFIFIERQNSNNTQKSWINVSVDNDSTNIIVNETYYPSSDMPVLLDLTDQLNKYDDSDHEVTIDFQYHNTYGYYYLSNAGNLVGDQLAAKLIVQVW